MVQRRFRTVYDTEPPTDKATREWYTKFQQSVCLCAAKRTSRLGPSAETVERVRGTLVRSPKKSTHRANRELWMPQSSVWRILRKRLRVEGYRLQPLQALNPQDHNRPLHFCVDFQQRLEEDGFAKNLVFSDEATFHVCGKANRHNVRIWGTENPHAPMEHVRHSSKVSVFCAVSSCKVYGPFFFAESSVTGINYLDVLQLWLMPQLQKIVRTSFSNKTEPRHTSILTSVHTSAKLPGRWIGRASHNDSPLLPWPPRSPYLTPCNFFYGVTSRIVCTCPLCHVIYHR